MKRILLKRQGVSLIKLTLVQSILALLFLSSTYGHSAGAQEYLKQTISIKPGNKPLKHLFTEIENATGLRFFYSSNVLDVNTEVEINHSKKLLKDVLNETLQPLGVDYQLKGKRILLSSTGKKPASNTEDTFKGSTLEQRLIDRPITGKVTDADGEPLPGVSVIKKGSQIGTITDEAGNYTLVLPDGENTLMFSFVGYISKEIEVSTQTNISVSLTIDNKTFDEIVVIGYGTQRKRDIISAVSVISVDDIGDVPASNVTRMLQGQAAGVVAKQKNGTPGGQFEVRIRGVGSLGAGSDPLYVIDGFAVGTSVGQNINPNDIESISILKDAASTAIYGARGSNGVVLITTKSGKEGKVGLSFSLDYGIQNLPDSRKVKVLNGVEFAQFKKDVFSDRYYFDSKYTRYPTLEEIPEGFRHPEQTRYSTNWYEAILHNNAPYTDLNLSLSSGKGPIKSLLSIGYYKEDGALQYTNYDRLSVRSNLEGEINKFIKVGANINGSYSKSRLANTDGRNSIVGSALIMDPREPMYNEDGSLRPYIGGLDGVFGFPNPLFALREISRNRNIADILSNAYLELNLMKGLKFRSSVNVRLKYENNKQFVPSTIGVSLGSGLSGAPPRIATASENTDQLINFSTDQLLTYQADLGPNHQMDLLAGISTQKETVNGLAGTGNTFPDDLVPYLGAAIIRASNSYKYDWTMLAYLARLNYAFKDKYLFSASMRREGSSRFGQNSKYGNFPSVSVGWRLSEEEFMPKPDWMTDLKFRGSWGVTGNNDIGNYRHLAFMRTENYILGNAIVPGKLVESFANADLKWEKSNQLDIGMDLSMLNNQLTITAEWYKKITRDMLFNVPVPSASGFTSVWTNLGKVQNKGLELAADYRFKVGPVNLKTNANITFNRSKILQLRGDDATPIWSGGMYGGYNVQKIGRPIGMIYGYKKLGIFNTFEEIDAAPLQDGAIPGSMKFWDADGNGEVTYDTQDMVEIGNPNPDFTWAWTVMADYKNFDLSIQFTGAENYQIYRNIESSTMNMDGVFNVLDKAKDRWRSPENPGSNPLDKHSQGGTDFWKWGRESSERYVYDASHVWLKNISLGYTLQTRNPALKNARIFLSATNLFLITKYPGNNPEANQQNGTTELGYDDESYPVPRTLAAGLRLNF